MNEYKAITISPISIHKHGNDLRDFFSRYPKIDFFIVKELYEFVKEHLRKDWFDNKKATQRGRLIKV